MADIINITEFPGGPEAYRRELEKMDRAELMAQQITQRGAIHAVEFLIANGGGIEIAKQMKDSLAEWLMILHEIANARGITLASYEGPEDSHG